MNGIGCVNVSKSYKTGTKQLDIKFQTKYSRDCMKDVTFKDYLAALLLFTPVFATLAFAIYKLALEVWCMLHGLIY